MGEVYRATDTKLKREVAIKVLPPRRSPPTPSASRASSARRSSSPSSSTRTSPRSTASRSRTASRALVMELVEGEDLAERLKRGPLPLDEALAVARQIAEALEEAHEKGIVHRDLKPANVKLTPDGKVKVLDFGLAKAMDAAEAPRAALVELPTSSHSPTLRRDRHAARRDPRHRGLHGARAGARAAGRQARRHLGLRRRPLRDADRRSGSSTARRSATRSPAVLKREIDSAACPPARRPPIRARSCAAASSATRKSRLHDIARRAASSSQAAAHAPATSAARRGAAAPRRPAAAGAALVGAPRPRRAGRPRLPSVASWRPRRRRRAPTVVRRRSCRRRARFDLESGPAPSRSPPTGAASPSRAEAGDGRRALWVRALDALDGPPSSPGTEDAHVPVLVARRALIGFFTGAKLRKIDGPATGRRR